MQSVADDVYLLDGFPRYAVNVYLVGDVLIDAGTRLDKGRILRQLNGRAVTAHAITHAHPDHQGASHAVCERLSIPLWAPEGDADAVEAGDLTEMCPKNPVTRLMNGVAAGPAHPVAQRLREADHVAGFTVINTPGHSPGHIAYWRESDRVLILGDVLFGMNPATMASSLHEPPGLFTVNPSQNRDSARKLAPLRPAIICFGHGKPWRDTDAFTRFIEKLPG